MIAKMVTTIDNPFNYFTQFDDWYAYDTAKGYDTLNYVARIANVSSELSDKDYTQAVNFAVDDILRLNLLGIYKEVSQEQPGTSEDDEEDNIENIL